MNLKREFEENWKGRNEIKPETRGSLSNWWENEPQLHYLAVPVDSVKDHLEEILEKIEDVDGVEPYEKQFLHMTVKVFEEKPDQEKIEEVIDNYTSFNIKLQNLNVFPQVLLIESPTPEIREINADLSKVFESKENDGDAYLPHISIGIYKQNNWREIIEEIESIRDKIEPKSFKADELVLLKDKESDKPEFEIIENFNLD